MPNPPEPSGLDIRVDIAQEKGQHHCQCDSDANSHQKGKYENVFINACVHCFINLFGLKIFYKSTTYFSLFYTTKNIIFHCIDFFHLRNMIS